MIPSRRYPAIPEPEWKAHLRQALARRGRWFTLFDKDAPPVAHHFPWYSGQQQESAAMRCASWNGLRRWVQK